MSLINKNANAVTAQELAAMIDHTLLKPDAAPSDIVRLCAEADAYGFCSVCVNPSFVSLASKSLKNPAVKVCTVVGFPLGASATAVKVFEAQKALEDGASEIDMVAAIGMAKAGKWDFVKEDILSVTKAVKAKVPSAVVKVIFETCLLDDAQIRELCRICTEAGVDFVKTSTGFSTGGATVHHVSLMKESVGDGIRVKASGGIRSYADAMAMIEAGADRLGTSAGIAIAAGADTDRPERN